MGDDDFEPYYDGPLALRPFMRAWVRDRWSRLCSWIKYRVLRRKRPVPAPNALDLSALTELYKSVYTPERIEQMANSRSPGFGALNVTVKRTSPASQDDEK